MPPPAKIKKRTFECCVEGCVSETGCGVTLHRFPKESAEKWQQEICTKNKQELIVNSSTRLCQLHFNSWDFDGASLKHCAIPSIFPKWVYICNIEKFELLLMCIRWNCDKFFKFLKFRFRKIDTPVVPPKSLPGTSESPRVLESESLGALESPASASTSNLEPLLPILASERYRGYTCSLNDLLTVDDSTTSDCFGHDDLLRSQERLNNNDQEPLVEKVNNNFCLSTFKFVRLSSLVY